VAILFTDVTAERAAARERERLLAETEAARTALEAERGRLAEVFRQAPAFMHVLAGPDFVFEFANEAYYRLVGQRDLIGRPAFEALPEAADGGFQERIAGVMATGEPFVGRELPVTLARTPGAPPEERLIDLVYVALPEPDGTCTRVLGHGVDVTDAVRARRDVERLLAAELAARSDAERAREAAEQANQAKAAFLATMSHELRTPLNAIGGYVELLQLGVRGPVTPAQLEDLERIQRAQRHLLRLINGVLNYAKIDAGAVRYDVADVSVGEVLHACEALVAPLARAKDVRLDYDTVPPSLRVRSDREKLQQIVLNLLSNAVKFTEPGGRVTLTGQAVGDAVRIIVADREWGSRRIRSRACSRRSCRWTQRTHAHRVAPGSGWRSAGTSRAAWAATSRCRARSAAGRRSP